MPAHSRPVVRAFTLLAFLPACLPAVVGWPEYLGDSARTHYSPLAAITPENVAQLRPAWEYATGEPGQMQCNPIMVDGVLYGVTSGAAVFALDAATGRKLWKHAPDGPPAARTLRGVTYWMDGGQRRIFFTVDSWLYALDARTGEVVSGFGEAGRTSLKAGLGDEARDRWVVSTTPGALAGDLIIMPTRVGEGAGSAPGFIQAFDVRTGALAWVFRTIPRPGETGFETWAEDAHRNPSIGGANSWAGMAVDQARGIIYVPTGSASPDFWGGDRAGDNLFANCLLALDARTGRRLWHFQFFHHDLWDRDLPAPPSLLQVRRGDRTIDAVAQVTKDGRVFVFDRVTGESLFPVEEISVPASEMAGEHAARTQPRPVLPTPFARQTLTEADINPQAENRTELLERFRRAKTGAFQPFSAVQDTIIFPGYDGGAEWGGVAVDPQGVLYVNANEMAWVARLLATPRQYQLAELTPGQRAYATYCQACHGPGRQGNPASGAPSLLEIGARLPRAEIGRLVTTGRNMMPGFPMLTATEQQSLLDHLLGSEKVEGPGTAARPPAAAAPSNDAYAAYKLDGYVKFLDSQGYSAISPPWGSLTAIDLNTGRHLWRITLGEFKELSARGLPPTGTENYGGPVVTASGLLFIAATKDGMIRAFDKRTGALLWAYELPAPGFATPCTYEVAGRQYVVIACGGTKLGTKKGDRYVAFALPESPAN